MTKHYHGTPITPKSVLNELAGRSFCIPFNRHEQVVWCHKHGESNMIDNSAFSFWQENEKRKRLGLPAIQMDNEFWKTFYAWVDQWLAYQTTWAVIPDQIDGDVADNDALIKQWPHGDRGAPVWHMHESIDRLKRLCDEWPKVCLGSSAQFSVVGSDKWHERMTEAMNEICKTGRAPTWLHMLRGMAATRWGYPFASVDSTDIARNHNRPQNTARRMADVWDAIQCSPFWNPTPMQDELFGTAD